MTEPKDNSFVVITETVKNTTDTKGELEKFNLNISMFLFFSMT